MPRDKRTSQASSHASSRRRGLASGGSDEGFIFLLHEDERPCPERDISPRTRSALVSLFLGTLFMILAGPLQDMGRTPPAAPTLHAPSRCSPSSRPRRGKRPVPTTSQGQTSPHTIADMEIASSTTLIGQFDGQTIRSGDYPMDMGVRISPAEEMRTIRD